MKKILILSLSILLIYGCSPSNNSNGDSGINSSAPTNLTGQVISQTQIQLSWINNSNHLSWKIERKTVNDTFVEIASADSPIIPPTYTDNNLTPNTTYIYRVYYYSPEVSSPYSNELSITTSSLPVVTTIAPTSITANTATSGGIITNAGVTTITEKGVVWSRIIQPQTQCNYCDRTIDGSGAGSFTSSLTELGENITYYLKAYIKIPSYGVIYGNEITFTTLNYQTQNVTICNQVWMQKNLNTSHYRNGDVIPQVTDIAQWEALTSGAWCYYNNDPSTGAVYGKLYNWYAVTDPRGLAPTGYHVPSYTEFSHISTLDCNDWNTDITFGGKLKEVGTTHWISPNTGATNETGFTGLPGGDRGSGLYPSSGFEKLGTKGCFWLSTGNGSWPISAFFLYNDSQSAAGVLMQNASKDNGYSVRCIKD